MRAGTRVLERVVPWSSLRARGGGPGQAWSRQTAVGRGDLLSWPSSIRGWAGRGAAGKVMVSSSGHVVIDVVERRRGRKRRRGQTLGSGGSTEPGLGRP
jgi:hypothetical protein